MQAEGSEAYPSLRSITFNAYFILWHDSGFVDLSVVVYLHLDVYLAERSTETTLMHQNFGVSWIWGVQ
jgi:hypothetical protein